MLSYHSRFAEKFSETIKAVFPILVIVLVLSFTITPIPNMTLILAVAVGIGVSEVILQDYVCWRNKSKRRKWL